MVQRLLLVLAVVIAQGCASAPSAPPRAPVPDPSPPAGTARPGDAASDTASNDVPRLDADIDVTDPDWFEKAMARERDLEPTVAVAAEDGSIRTRVPGTVSDPLRLDGELYILTFSAAPEVDVECVVFGDDLDLASGLDAMSTASLGEIAGHFGGLSRKGIDRVDAGVIDGMPYLAVDWIFLAGEADAQVAGHLKSRIAVVADHSVYCHHNGLGYRETFARAFETVVRELVVDEPPIEPYYEELTTMSVAGQNVGVSRVGFFHAEEGGTEIHHLLAMLVPVDDETLSPADTYKIERSDAAGDLHYAFEAASENGELVTELELAVDADERWSVQGTFQTKQLTSKVAAPASTPRSTLGQYVDLRALMAEAEVGRVLTLTSWDPDADPTVWTDIEVKLVEPHAEGFVAELVMGPLRMTGTLAPSGSLLSATIAMGGAELALERVHVRGDIVSP